MRGPSETVLVTKLVRLGEKRPENLLPRKEPPAPARAPVTAPAPKTDAARVVAPSPKAPNAAERVAENLKQEVAAVLPLDERVVVTAVNRGIPFMVDNKTQPVARGIFGLAESVRGRIAAMELEVDDRIAKR